MIKYEEKLLEIYGDKVLEKCMNKLAFSMIYSKNRVIIDFQTADQFSKEFKSRFGAKFPLINELDMVTSMISLE